MNTRDYGIKLVQRIEWLGASDMKTVENREILLAYGMSLDEANQMQTTFAKSKLSGQGKIYGDTYNWHNSYEVVVLIGREKRAEVNSLLLEDTTRVQP